MTAFREATASQRTSSAMRPFFPLVLVVFPACVVAAVQVAEKSPWLALVFVAFAFLAVVAFAVGLFFFMLKDPKRLQTEAYLIKQASV